LTTDAPTTEAASAPSSRKTARGSRSGLVQRLLTVNLAVLTVLVLLLFFLPTFVDDRALITVLGIANCYVMFAASWDILSGFTGQVNFGHAAFIGGGGFIVGLLSRFAEGVPAVGQLAIATVGAALLGVIIGVPCLRLKGPYLALATLSAAAALLQLSFIFKAQTGGEEGISGVNRLTDSEFVGGVGIALSKLFLGGEFYDDLRPLAQSTYVNFYVTLVVMVLVVGGLLKLGYGRRGLVLRSIQQDETAAEAAGVPVVRYKLGAFVLSGALAGLAGGLLVQVRGSVGIDLLFIDLSLLIIIIAALGGVGSIIGPAIGAYIVVLLQLFYLDKLSFFQANPELKLGAFSLLVIVLLIVQPKGLIPPLMKRLNAPAARRNAMSIAAMSAAGAGQGSTTSSDVAVDQEDESA
jgi:branched-chain amino acid transport system permease protein